MKCEVYMVFKFIMITVMGILSLTLLLIPDYFSIKSGEIQFSLTNVKVFSDKMSYDEFSNVCVNYEVTDKICNNLSKMSRGGMALFSFIVVDIFILCLYLIINLIQLYIAHKILSEGLKILQVSPRQRNILKCCHKLKVVVIGHPFAVILGTGVWIKLSNIDKLSNQIILESGTIILIIQCFFSLLSIAGYLWEASSIKRRVARLKNNYQLKYSQNSEPKGVSRCSGTKSDKSLELDVSIEQ